MQEFHDERMREIKIISEFDIILEKQLLAMSIDDFYFHVMVKKEHRSDG